MVSVRVSDIYDLSTKVGKIGLIAVHTPNVSSIYSLWKGLFDNYRFYRIAACDVSLVCAQTLPVDPLQVGQEAGTIAPQDLFNPILYKAVSNESFNRVLARLNVLNDVATSPWSTSTIAEGDLAYFGESDEVDQFKTYYGLLADGDGWKKAMPQNGLTMKGLYPMVYQVVNTFGNEVMGPGGALGDGKLPVAGLDDVPGFDLEAGEDILYKKATTFRGHAMRMPRIPTKSASYNANGQTNVEYTMCPLTYVMAMLTPPAKNTKLYYRMRVTWTIEFEEIRPLTDTMSFSNIAAVGAIHYASDYVDQSKAMDAKTDLVDAKDVEIEKIMTTGK